MKRRNFNHKEEDQLNKLKRENKELKRTVSLLRKELSKRESILVEAEQIESNPIVIPSPAKETCPKCNSEKLRKVELRC